MDKSAGPPYTYRSCLGVETHATKLSVQSCGAKVNSRGGLELLSIIWLSTWQTLLICNMFVLIVNIQMLLNRGDILNMVTSGTPWPGLKQINIISTVNQAKLP